MDRKGLVIWIIGMLLLGSMAAYLFAQANRNREELDRQASRNLLMMRDALKKSISDKRWEIRSFIRYRVALDLDTSANVEWSKLYKAAESQKRDKNKFKFEIESKSGPAIAFSESITLSGFLFDQICEGLIKKQYHKNALSKLVIASNDYSSKSEESNLSCKVPYESVVREFVSHNTFFDKLVLADTSGEVLYPEDLKGINFKSSLDSMSARFSNGSSDKFEIRLNSTPYIVYLTPLVEENQEIWVLGLKDREDLEKAAYKIDFTILTVSGLALILLLILTPALSFISMGKGDVLTQGRVTKIGFSMLILMVIAGWSCAYFIHLGSPLNKERSYEQKTRQELRTKLIEMLRYLESDQFNNTQSKYGVPSSVNEIFTAHNFATFTDYSRGASSEKSKDGTLGHYRIGACINCSNEDLDYSYISVRHRNYFKHFQNSDNLSDFFVERIFSQLTGIPQNIMSKWHSEDKVIRAISFTLDSLPLDSDRSYLLVKEDGEVIHTSKKFEIPFTQLESVLNFDDWEIFETLADYNKDTAENDTKEIWDFPLRINGQHYRALISSVNFEKEIGIPDQTYWFIYLMDPNVYHLKSGLSSWESCIGPLNSRT